MIIPTHIWSYIQRVENELQREYEKTREIEITVARIKVQKIREELMQEELAISADKMGYENIFSKLQEISRLANEFLIYPALARIYIEVNFSPDVIYALNRTYPESPDLKKEIRKMAHFFNAIKEIPNGSLTNDDAEADYREFKLLITMEEWVCIARKRKTKVLKLHFKEVHVAIEYTETLLQDRIKFLGYEKWKKFEYELGNYKKMAEKWLRVGRTCTYYIYISEDKITP